MSVPTNYLLAATGLLLVALTSDARAQANLPPGPASYDHNFQLFAPLELDLDNMHEDETYGYYFNYDKLVWSYSGERVTVGNPNVFAMAETIFYQNSDDQGTENLPPDNVNNVTGAPVPDGNYDTYQIVNGLQDVVPNAGMGWGNRYELGYRDGDAGWEISVLDGPQVSQTEVYGIGPNTPIIDEDYTAGNDVDIADTIAGGDLRAFGYGSVHVNFDVPTGYLFGLRDYVDTLGDMAIGTQAGPILYVGNYGMNSATDAPDANNDDLQYVFFRLADDLDGDGVFGAFIVADLNSPNGYRIVHDFDDLHHFNVAFDQVTVRNITKSRGIEAMWTEVLTNSHYQAKFQNNHLEFSYGARFLRLYDNFSVLGVGGILGQSFWDTTFVNQIVGPQVGLKWRNQRQRWTLTADTKFLFGYNVRDWEQSGGIGEELIPGALNRPFFGQPTYFNRGLQQQDFSPVAELRVQSAYNLTQSVALKLGYTGMYIGNIRRASTSIRYSLPDLGYNETGSQEVLVNGVDFGVEIVH